MSKYAALGDYLRKQRTTLIPMTFVEIERIVGSKLPKSQRYPAWWSNNPWNNVMTKVWLEAGFETEQVDVEARKLVFRRVRSAASSSEKSLKNEDTAGSTPHPIVGWMKGTVRIAPGIDLTEPADPDWGERAWGDQK
jgi:hypothetical protein